MNKNSCKNTPINIDVKTKDCILTPLTCAGLITEFIKLLVYNKLQIPYPYSWLKTSVNKRLLKENSETCNPKNRIVLDKHFRIASNALNIIDNLSRQLHKEFKDNSNKIDCIVVLFGATPLTPKETYSLKIPTLCKEHNEANHLCTMEKTVNKILRNIIFTSEWTDAVNHTLPPTNMYVLLQKRSDLTKSMFDFFTPIDSFKYSNLGLKTNIQFENTNTKSHDCCSNLLIYQDSPETCSVSELGVKQNEDKMCSNDSNNCVNDNLSDLKWYQANETLKGFKDHFIEKQSVSSMW